MRTARNDDCIMAFQLSRLGNAEYIQYADSVHATAEAAERRLNQLDPNEDACYRSRGGKYVVYRFGYFEYGA